MGKTYTPIWFLPTAVNSKYRNNYDEIFSKKEGRQQKADQAKSSCKKNPEKAKSFLAAALTGCLCRDGEDCGPVTG